jgi:hypothetical protein
MYRMETIRVNLVDVLQLNVHEALTSLLPDLFM